MSASEQKGSEQWEGQQRRPRPHQVEQKDGAAGASRLESKPFHTVPHAVSAAAQSVTVLALTRKVSPLQDKRG